MDTPQEDPLKQRHRRVFEQGQETVAQEVAVKLLAEQTEYMEEAGQVVSKALDAADRLAEGGDPYKRRVAELIKQGVVRSLETFQQVATSELSVMERRAALNEAVPFSEGSPPSPASLPEPREGPKALSHETNGEPPRRGPGRPRKDLPSETAK